MTEPSFFFFPSQRIPRVARIVSGEGFSRGGLIGTGCGRVEVGLLETSEPERSYRGATVETGPGTDRTNHHLPPEPVAL